MPTLLVVDDEPRVLSFVAKGMARHGWTVHQASTIAEGLEFARHTAVDVALCDVVMPKAGGFEFTQGMRELSNGVVPVVLMSGYPIASKPQSEPSWGPPPLVLNKPFRLQELASVLAEALPSYA